MILVSIPTLFYDIYISVRGEHNEWPLVGFFMMWIVASNTVVDSVQFVVLFSFIRNKTANMLKELHDMCMSLKLFKTIFYRTKICPNMTKTPTTERMLV